MKLQGASQFTAAFAALLVAASACGRRSAPALGEWIEMRTRQIAVRLEPGTTSVEIRHVAAGPLDRVADRPYFLEVTSDVTAAGTTLDRAYALCLWVGERAYADGEPRIPRSGAELVVGPDGRTVLERIAAGCAFNCLSLATVFVDAARARGMLARPVALAVRDGSAYEGHAVGEVWSPELRKWVLVDPTYGITYTVNGRPADALELHDAMTGGRTAAIRVVRDPRAEALDPWEAEINPLHYFRNFYRPAGEDGPWLRYAGGGAPPALVAREGYVQTDSQSLFGLDPGFAGEVPLQVGHRHGRIVYQAVGGVLYVCLEDGRFVPGRFSARATAGADVAFTPELAAYDPGDAVLVAPEELAPNPTFADADGDATPDGWRLDAGAASFSRIETGELVVETGADGAALSAAVPDADGLALAATLRARVEHGGARFAIRDRRPDDYVAIPPGAMVDTSPVLMRPSARRLALRLALEPNTRCVLDSVSLRRERLLEEFVPRPSP
jgi:hypothetical protein